MRILTWQDRMLTSLLSVGLALVTVLLALLPWPFLLHYGVRIGGLLALGPHMYFVGRRRQQQKADAAAEEARFQAADAKGKALILQEHRDRMMEKAKARIAANEAASARKIRTEAQLKRCDAASLWAPHCLPHCWRTLHSSSPILLAGMSFCPSGLHA